MKPLLMTMVCYWKELTMHTWIWQPIY